MVDGIQAATVTPDLIPFWAQLVGTVLGGGVLSIMAGGLLEVRGLRKDIETLRQSLIEAHRETRAVIRNNRKRS